MKKKLFALMLFMLPLIAWAQKAYYPIGTDVTFNANHASTILKKQKGGVLTAGQAQSQSSYINEESKGGCYLLFWAGRNYLDETVFSYTQPSATLKETETPGVFEGYVQFDHSAFTITRALATTEIDVEEDEGKYHDVLEALRPYRYGALEHPISFDTGIGIEENLESPQDFWMPNYDPSVTYYVKVDFNTKTMAVCTSKDKDPLQSQTDVVYLIGNDGIMDANHASATLAKVSDGVYEGEVTFSNQFFYVTKKLANSADDWTSIDQYVWAGNQNSGRVLEVGEPLKMSKSYSEWGNIPFRVEREGTYKTTVNTKDETILIVDNPDVPDIDLSSGAHFSITLSQPGTLKQRLTNAVFQTDYDLVDFLTVKGKMNSEDLKYIHSQEGLVSQLQYLDLSDVELEYDDQPYFSYYVAGLPGSPSTSVTYYLSAENKVVTAGGGYNDMMTNYTSIYRNNLAHAFSSMQYLKQCKLPKTLTGIGESILYGCPLLKVTLPTAPTYIWGEAFYGTQMKSIDLPESVEFIGDNAFRGVPLTTINVSHVTSIGDYCFTGSSLKSITLSNKLKKLSKAMLAGTWITEIAIPTSVTEIGEEAFSGSKLRTIDIPASVAAIGVKAFYGCKQLGSVTMGNGVKSIGDEAFMDCDNLTNMTVSANVEEIGDQAFSNVPWAENIAAENGVKYIGKVAYKHVSGTSLNIKNGTVSIADNFVNTGVGISSITLPSTLRILGKACLRSATIGSIELPESLEKIGSWAMADNSKLRRVTIPRNVSFIGRGAFENTQIVRIYYNAENAMTEVEDAKYGYYYCPFPNSVTRAIIGEGVKTIPPALFDQCENLVRVQMPSTVEHIGRYAFNCSNLEHIDLPSALKSMDESAICGVTSITAYMKEPFSLPLWPSDIEELMWEDVRVKDAIEQGEAYDDSWARTTPFGNQIEYRYHIDEQGHLTWGEASVPQDEYRIPQLQVPNGSLAAYQGDATWANAFRQIVPFDGASDAETVNETTSVSVSNTVTDDTDLAGSLIGNVYVTLDTEDSGDGYNASEGCIVINSITTEEGLEASTADDADDLTVKNQFNGLIFEVPAGKGSVVIDCQTLGQNVIFVKIGASEPKKVETTTKQQMTIPYEVSEATRIYVYAAKAEGSTNAAPARVTSIQPHRAAYANDDAVKIFGLTINVDENASGISAPTVAESSCQSIWHTLDGRRITNPVQKGIYITNGRKVVVK